MSIYSLKCEISIVVEIWDYNINANSKTWAPGNPLIISNFKLFSYCWFEWGHQHIQITNTENVHSHSSWCVMQQCNNATIFFCTTERKINDNHLSQSHSHEYGIQTVTNDYNSIYLAALGTTSSSIKIIHNNPTTAPTSSPTSAPICTRTFPIGWAKQRKWISRSKIPAKIQILDSLRGRWRVHSPRGRKLPLWRRLHRLRYVTHFEPKLKKCFN